MKSQEELNKEFENPSIGENYGGNYPRLSLEPGAVSEMLIHVKDTSISLAGDEPGTKKDVPVNVFQEVESGLLVTGPIGAIFKNTFDDAKVRKGDQFRIKRYADATKKEGKGKGNVMQVYGIKIFSRVTA